MSIARPTIAVLGPGGVGGLVAGALARDGVPVTVVAREQTAALISERGLRVDSATLGSFVARPTAVSRLDAEVDVLVAATKAGGLRGALERVGRAPGTVLPLLNGIEHLALLRDRFQGGAPGLTQTEVLAGTIRVEADRVEPARIVHTSPSVRIEMASAHAAARPAMESLSATLTHAGLPALVLDSEEQVMWSKLVRLNALACTTSAFEQPLGTIRSTPALRADLVAAVEEGAAVARAQGARLDATATLAELDGAHASLTSSMARDLAAGRRPELDAIAGSVLRAGRRTGLACPTIERLVTVIERRLPPGGRGGEAHAPSPRRAV